MKPQIYLAPDGVLDVMLDGLLVGSIRLKPYAIEVTLEAQGFDVQVSANGGITALFRLRPAAEEEK
jgi:hypothetical protein